MDVSIHSRADLRRSLHLLTERKRERERGATIIIVVAFGERTFLGFPCRRVSSSNRRRFVRRRKVWLCEGVSIGDGISFCARTRRAKERPPSVASRARRGELVTDASLKPSVFARTHAHRKRERQRDRERTKSAFFSLFKKRPTKRPD